MKYILLFFIGIHICFGQVNISEQFTDSNFSTSPKWFGDTSSFIVNANHKLQLMAESNPSPQHLYILSQALDSGIWTFHCRMDFNPSNQNYLNIILNTDSSFSDQNLIKIELGKSSDKIRIYSIENGTSTLLTESANAVLINNTNSVWGKLTHLNSNWTLEYSVDSINWNQIPSFQYTSNPLNTFGFECNFTTTRKDKFFFDDISIYGYSFRDSLPPKLQSHEIIDSFRCRLTFNEPILTHAIQLQNFEIIDQPNKIESFSNINSQEIQLSLKDLEFNEEYELRISGIKDLYNNPIKDTIIHLDWQKINLYDIQFSEIMIDPSPPVYLPEIEYIEIKNTSINSIDLTNCILTIGEKKLQLPKFNIPADSLAAIYSPGDKLTIDSSWNTIFLSSNFSLPNTEGELSFSDSNQNIIHHISYSDNWYKNVNKSDGGWSIENTNYDNPCLQWENWKASTHTNGGSPGIENSQSDNTSSTSNMISTFCLNDTTLHLEFPFTILEPSFIDKSNFESTLPIKSMRRINPFTLQINFQQSLLTSELYYLDLKPEVQPCFMKEFELIQFGLTSIPNSNSIVLSEIKFNTSSDYSEYLEFKIIDNNHIDLYDLALSINIDSSEEIVTLSNRHHFIEKNSYFVLAKDLDLLKTNYPINPDAFYIEIDNWKSFSDDWGTIKLLTRDHETLDSNCYNESWHSVFLSEVENVSLEKIDLDILGCINENWTSASETSNYGTPGYENSQTKNEHSESIDFMTHFSPNNDGIEDFWSHTINFNTSENVVDAYVLDLDGFTKLTLAKRSSVGTQYVIHWDGRDENEESLPFGTYIIVVNLIESNNIKNVLKRAITIVEE